MNLKQLYYLSVSLVVGLILTACDPWADDTKLIDGNVEKPLNELIQANGELSTFAEVLRLTGYDEVISTQQSLTVFAPSDQSLTNLDLNDKEQLTKWVQNHIAYLTYCTDNEGDFEVDNVQMLNGKQVSVSTGAISGSQIKSANIMAENGVLHIIDNQIIERLSIWEYMQTQEGSTQVDFITSCYEEVMDMDRSTPVGLNENGQQVYDTVWMTQNTFLDAYPIDDNQSTFSVVLLENEAISLLQTKYNKYLAQPDSIEQEKEVMRQIASDLILEDLQEISEKGRYQSIKELLVDLDPKDIVDSYRASNGWVYKLSAGDVKMYENKIKELFIEAEDYVSRYDGESGDPVADRWLRRARTYASGGYDMVLKGWTRNYVNWEDINEDGTTTTGRATYNYRYPTRLANQLCTRSNAYIEYQPTLYSVGYNIYWMSYATNDELTLSSADTGSDTTIPPMNLEQKLMISFAGAPNQLTRSSSGTITGNFSNNSVMAGANIAGVHEETKLTRYRTNNAAGDGLFILGALYTGEDAFGSGDVLLSPSFGPAKFYVANTVRETGNYVGMIYLDYIRIVPLVDPND